MLTQSIGKLIHKFVAHLWRKSEVPLKFERADVGLHF